MNIITKNLVKDFLTENEFPSQNESVDFEKFSVYSVARKYYSSEFDLSDIVVGSGADTGLDGIILIVNGMLVNSKEEIDDLRKRNNYLDVVWILVQAKTSQNFDSGDVNKFCLGVEDFFLSSIGLQANNDIVEKKSLWEHIFSNHAVALRNNPKCYLYYVCNGVVNDSLNDHLSITNNLKNKLEQASLFSSIAFKLCGANEINALYKEARNNLTCQIYFASKTSFPQIKTVTSAYIGLLPLKEFKKLIVDEDGNVKNVFEDNIRDFLDLTNPVNSKINDTLNGEDCFLFPLMNNGVTIVANRLQQTGDVFILFDYQIVNGCQTSNVLAKYIDKDSLGDLSIPVKIIETTDIDTKNNITLATNSQTQVKREQLAALSNFQKTLEVYYNAASLTPKLFYERRSNQFLNDGSVIKARIITVQNQIKAFAAMFLKKPHQVTSYYGELTKNLGMENSDIFNPKHQPLTYYLAGHCLYRLEAMFRAGSIDSTNKKYRFFILFGFVSAILKNDLKSLDFTSERVNAKNLKPLQDILEKQDGTNTLLKTITDLIVSSSIITGKESLKLSSTTEAVYNLCCNIAIP